MLRKLQHQISRKTKGTTVACKCRFDFDLHAVEGLPRKVQHCRLQLKRSPKTQITQLHEVEAGKCTMHETVSFVATMYRDQDGSFESKKYTLILQVPERPGSTNTEKLLMFGSAPIDLGDYAVAVGDAPQPLRVEVPLKMRSGRSMLVTGAVQVSIVQAKIALDGMTNLSGGSKGSLQPTASFMQMEQDLEGFSEYDISDELGSAATDSAMSSRNGRAGASRRGRPPMGPPQRSGSLARGVRPAPGRGVSADLSGTISEHSGGISAERLPADRGGGGGAAAGPAPRGGGGGPSAPLSEARTESSEGHHSGGLESTPRMRGHNRTRTGKFGSSGAAAVAAVVHEETAALEDVQAFLDESAATASKSALLASQRELEQEKQNAEQLQAALLDTQRKLEARDAELAKARVYSNAAATAVKLTESAALTREELVARLHEAEQRGAQLEAALAMLQDGPAGEMVAAWTQERAELLTALEEAEDRILRMQGQLSEREAEVAQVQRTIAALRSEKQALEDDAMNLSDRQMQLSHANRMLANELQEQQRGFGTNEYDSSTSDLSLPGAPAADAAPAQPPANGKLKGGIGSKGGSDWDPVAAGAGVPADVLARARARRHNVIDIREYEDVVAELAHRKLEIAFGRERELIMRNALSKGKERYLQLQSRLTRIETSMYSGGRRR